MSSKPSSSSTGWSKSTSPYHRGEQMVQEKAGAREFAERIGRQVIRDFMTQQHRDFYATLPFIFAGSLDAAKRPWASILWGPPGFISSPDPQRLQVRARPAAGDPLRENLKTGAPVALVGVQFETRRRNRLTGWVEHAGDHGFDLAVGQSFGNCPQYIQARQPHFVAAPDALTSPQGSPAPEGALLSGRAQALIMRSDTFFIASASPHAGVSDPVEGADVNHRGGRQGFVQVTTEQGTIGYHLARLRRQFRFQYSWKYHGQPGRGTPVRRLRERATCSASPAKQSCSGRRPDARTLRGAERLVQLTVEEGVYIAGALPLRWGPPEYATQLSRTGVWGEALRDRQLQTLATQYRPFVIERTEDESATVRSFFLAPADGLDLLPHLPGQFLPIAIEARKRLAEVRRTYTISNQLKKERIA
jgi:predicted pyridoxine 5'-phosphate oxidase superfamily flavin-nucleotide-binding protein